MTLDTAKITIVSGSINLFFGSIERCFPVPFVNCLEWSETVFGYDHFK